MFKSKQQPLCRHCGGKIAKYTDTHWIERDTATIRHDDNRHHYMSDADWPKSKADCQKLTNEEVVSVTYHQDYSSDDGYKRTDKIWRFGVWDRESYVDEFFCNGDHARRFAYSCAREGYSTYGYRKAKEKQNVPSS